MDARSRRSWSRSVDCSCHEPALGLTMFFQQKNLIDACVKVQTHFCFPSTATIRIQPQSYGNCFPDWYHWNLDENLNKKFMWFHGSLMFELRCFSTVPMQSLTTRVTVTLQSSCYVSCSPHWSKIRVALHSDSITGSLRGLRIGFRFGGFLELAHHSPGLCSHHPRFCDLWGQFGNMLIKFIECMSNDIWIPWRQ